MANVHQYGQQTDKKLNDLSEKIGEATQRKEQAQSDYDENWEMVNSLFDEMPDKGNRFIAKDGYTLAREPRTLAAKLDQEKLQSLIYQKYPQKQATQIWNSITIRTVDPDLLEAAVRMHKVDPEIKEQSITPGAESSARTRRKWSKEDRERARILGIDQEA